MRAIKLEGIFRISSSKADSDALRNAYNSGEPVDVAAVCTDVHAAAGTVKSFLRELPECLLTRSFYPCFLALAGEDGSPIGVDECANLITLLPPAHRDLLCYLLTFFRQVADHCGDNKMPVENVAIVVGPNIFRLEHLEPTEEIQFGPAIQRITRFMIENAVVLYAAVSERIKCQCNGFVPSFGHVAPDAAEEAALRAGSTSELDRLRVSMAAMGQMRSGKAPAGRSSTPDAEAEKNLMKVQLEEAHADNVKAQSELAALKSELSALKAENATLSSDNASLRAEVASLKDAQTRMVTIQDRDRLDREVQALATRQVERDATIKAQQGEINALMAAKRVLATEVVALKKAAAVATATAAAAAAPPSTPASAVASPVASIGGGASVASLGGHAVGPGGGASLASLGAHSATGSPAITPGMSPSRDGLLGLSPLVAPGPPRDATKRRSVSLQNARASVQSAAAPEDPSSFRLGGTHGVSSIGAVPGTPSAVPSRIGTPAGGSSSRGLPTLTSLRGTNGAGDTNGHPRGPMTSSGTRLNADDPDDDLNGVSVDELLRERPPEVSAPLAGVDTASVLPAYEATHRRLKLTLKRLLEAIKESTDAEQKRQLKIKLVHVKEQHAVSKQIVDRMRADVGLRPPTSPGETHKDVR